VRDFIARVRERALGAEVLKSLTPAQQVIGIVNEELIKILGDTPSRLETAARPPTVILLVGLQGSGKTTLSAKLALHLRKQGGRPLLIAADIYRPAAVDQLVALGRQIDIPVWQEGTKIKPIEIVEHGMTEARRIGSTYVIIDTAGRLQNKTDLMAELEKIIRVIKKIDESAPHTVLLTLDATTGQNALNQVEIFGKTAGVTGLIMTKLDGTARGGILVAIADKHKLPVHAIGVGEGAEDLQPFDAGDFARAIAGL
jgi:signal recognition particle GTPase